MAESVLSAAWSSVKGHDGLVAALEKAKSAPLVRPRAYDEARRSVLLEAGESMMAGGDVPGDLGRRMQAIQAEVEEATAARDALVELQALLKESLAAVKASGADEALRFLAGQLGRVVEQVRVVDGQLGPVRSADDAIAAGGKVPTAWKALGGVVAAYDELRDAQRAVLMAAVGPDGLSRKLTLGGLFSNVAVFDPLWRRRERSEHGAGPAPWPFPARGAAAWWPTSDRASYLRWVATGPAVAWVPSLEAFDEAVVETLGAAERDVYERDQGTVEERRLRVRELKQPEPREVPERQGGVDVW